MTPWAKEEGRDDHLLSLDRFRKVASFRWRSELILAMWFTLVFMAFPYGALLLVFIFLVVQLAGAIHALVGHWRIPGGRVIGSIPLLTIFLWVAWFVALMLWQPEPWLVFWSTTIIAMMIVAVIPSLVLATRVDGPRWVGGLPLLWILLVIPFWEHLPWITGFELELAWWSHWLQKLYLVLFLCLMSFTDYQVGKLLEPAVIPRATEDPGHDGEETIRVFS